MISLISLGNFPFELFHQTEMTTASAAPVSYFSGLIETLTPVITSWQWKKQRWTCYAIESLIIKKKSTLNTDQSWYLSIIVLCNQVVDSK